jgi:hypothetical protein
MQTSLKISTLRPSKVAHHLNKYTKKVDRHCSCCKETTHTINNCDDSRIYDLQLDCERSLITTRSEISYKYWLTNHIDHIVAKALCLNLGLVKTAKQVNTKEKTINILMEAYWFFDVRERHYNNVIRQIELLEIQRNMLEEFIEEEEEEEEQAQEQENTDLDDNEGGRSFMIGVYHKEYEQLCQDFNITDHECPICQESKTESPEKTYNIYNECGHQICTDCFKKSLKSLPEHKELCCAICRNQVIQITAPSDEESTGLFEIVLGLA